MAFNVNRSRKQGFEYAPDYTFKAAVSALEKSNKFSVKSSDPLSRTISAVSGVNWKSWGEKLLVTVTTDANGMSKIVVTSTSKYGLIDWGINLDNVNNVLNLISSELKNYNEITQDETFATEDIPT